MKYYKLVWYNDLTEKEQCDYISAEDYNDAYEIACMWIGKSVGGCHAFVEKAIRFLGEASEPSYITRKEMEDYWRTKNEIFKNSFFINNIKKI